MKSQSSQPQRRLSPWRVALALMLVAGLAFGGVKGLGYWRAEKAVADSYSPWFAAYVDVTATPVFPFEQMGATDTPNAVLAFVVAHPNNPCQPSWGAAYTPDQAGASLDLDRRIARLKQQGGSVAVSFGGLNNDELAVACQDPSSLKAAYKTIIDRYNINTIDLDLEQNGLSDTEAGERRAAAIAELQTEYRAQDKSLAVWATIPVAPQGLTQDGTNAISQLLSGGVDLAGVNVMTMDYGASREGLTVVEASKRALVETHRQLGILYDRSGTHLNNSSLWAKVGATPMVGQNDEPDEVFTVADAEELNSFAQSKGIARLSMWSANRDVACGSNYVDLKVVSTSCSGVSQEKGDFGLALSKSFEGDPALSAKLITTEDPDDTTNLSDDPSASPYPIWSETSAYLQDAKVVWRRNVYQAKWWNQGEIPDNPVLQAWETPWKLLGPVLPGEKPVKKAILPEGTYPEWQGATAYETGARVLFDGTPYQAKWWNQGESPAAWSSSASTSPWNPLTQLQINEVLEAQE